MNRLGWAIGPCLALSLGLCLSCQGQPPASAFDRERAWADLLAQCELGPRVPGTEAHAACADWIEMRLREAGWHVERDPFTARVALLGGEIEMVNLIALSHPGASPSMIFSAHWDTRPIADREPIPSRLNTPILGASDGASGVAVLLEVSSGAMSASAITAIQMHLSTALSKRPAYWSATDERLIKRALSA